MVVRLCGIIALVGLLVSPLAAEDFIPRRQAAPPGPALKPAEAIAKMTVPPGFSVELVAAEPDIVNPTAMAIDDRGRFWICESLEYPRQSPGPGKDRIKILEDTDGDGRADKTTIFAEGLNIPSGIALGYGGVWVANAPDLLFLQDTDGDGKADKQEVIITGFGRTDTHELPNSLTWGPDGWLYGLNGVFNYSHIFYPKTSPHYKEGHEGWKFTCALFRIHPRTREFQIFCEGTSNPWGLAIDTEGSFFVSACVIDHLWHLVESGYYIRQGGPYPPFTWKMNSIVDFKHQLAAYCGLHWYDSDAYPAKYRNRLYMGNIHASGVNSDDIVRHGSTYRAKKGEDFLMANDVWFMPVVQTTGPDGSLYILDWYDRYHCYQDANRDPAGVDRLNGRLYRVRYEQTPHPKSFDLSKDSDEQLLALLKSANGFSRDHAQRLLTERAKPELTPKLEALVKDEVLARHSRLAALWVLIGSNQLSDEFSLQLLNGKDAGLASWSVRAAGNRGQVSPAIREKLTQLSKSAAPDVLLQVAIAARKIKDVDTLQLLFNVLAAASTDDHLQHVVWQNLQPLLEAHYADFLKLAKTSPVQKTPGLAAIVPLLSERLLAVKHPESPPIVGLIELLIDQQPGSNDSLIKCLDSLTAKLETREINAPSAAALGKRLDAQLQKLLASDTSPALFSSAARLAVGLKIPAGYKALGQAIKNGKLGWPERTAMFNTLIVSSEPSALDAAFTYAGEVLPSSDAKARGQQAAIISGLARSESPRVAALLLEQYAKLPAAEQPKVIEVLTQRGPWAKELLTTIAAGKIPANVLNTNQIARLLGNKDDELAALVKKQWGAVRTERNPDRERVIAEMRNLIRRSKPGDALAGEKVYARVCAQCHKLHGNGQDVGPDITLNGRNSFEMLLSNVFDPSLVIGAAYQPRHVETVDGRTLLGLATEDNEQRVVLKLQGGKLETIPRAQIETITESKLSMMPEELEKQLKPEELCDLFAYLTLDKAPSDPAAKRLPGVYQPLTRKTEDPQQFNELVGVVAPGFRIAASGLGGVQLLENFRDKADVLYTHPVDRDKPCVMETSYAVPTAGATLRIVVAHDPRGDWELMLKIDKQEIIRRPVSKKSAPDGWLTIEEDLSKWAGKTIQIELQNRATEWSYEQAFWHEVKLIPKK
jgi:putative membrane-bound dehydrogenase-like protein